VITEEPPIEIPDSDVQLVAAQTGTNLPEAKAALQAAKGDLAAAIIKLASK
jgi:nascent polypeptide-associated complex subunit alpha